MRQLIITLVLIFSSPALAQSASSVGAMIGDVIPSGPDGITEIFGVGGVRYSTSGTGASQVDMGVVFGSASPTLWHDLFINTRYNMRSQGFSSYAGIGADFIRYRTAVEQTNEYDVLITDAAGNPILREETKTSVGLHILGGLTAELIRPVYLRTDIKLNITPALILTITAGLEWRFGERLETK